MEFEFSVLLLKMRAQELTWKCMYLQQIKPPILARIFDREKGVIIQKKSEYNNNWGQICHQMFYCKGEVISMNPNV